ncbi:MAG: hypothetical protein DSM107014_11835 [Gomphosphaeria aponina SAG 52.96 = DSM 107014]|uniref:Uncharacterized protein n=1 Tax=Gomphosphaeria aponina SAG 52.96 = DSM 107014 TaxID=1521640 RepID=A0A941JQ65_9CHRO|nr:hypothetical protein [Gomphosphaeria aponina SAG 52.96 = DSM 107014]
MEDSPVFQRWQEKIPNIWEDILNKPSFSTRLRLGYSQFPSDDGAGGISLGIEDIFIGKTGLTLSADYQISFNGDRLSVGTSFHYFLFPLGNYLNFAPMLGYRYLETQDYATDGVSLGVRLMLAFSRAGDISLSQIFVSPAGNDEVGVTTFSVGYAVTNHLRLSSDLQQQNSPFAKDSRVGFVFEWLL